jgi:hypothetical protein
MSRPQVIPAELVERLRNSHRFGRGMDTMDQLYFSMLSLKLHEGRLRLPPWAPCAAMCCAAVLLSLCLCRCYRAMPVPVAVAVL